MKKLTKIFLGIVSGAVAVVNYPGVADALGAFIMAHPKSILSGIGGMVIGALLHQPKSVPAAQ